MNYFKEKVNVLGLMTASFREWWHILKHVYPCIIALVVYEWVFTHLSPLVSVFWVKVTVLSVGSVAYFLLFIWLISSVHLLLIERDFTFKKGCSRMKNRLIPVFIALLMYLAISFGVMYLVAMFFETNLMLSAVHGFFQNPMIGLLLIGGIFTVFLYLCFMWMPFVAVKKGSVYTSILRSISLCMGDLWRQTALLFTFLIIMAIMISSRPPLLNFLRTYELKWLYNALIYSTLGLWLVTWMVLVMDNARFDTQDILKS